MAGKNIHDYLTPPDYDRFFGLYHEVTETVLSSVLTIRGYCRFLEHYASQVPDAFPDANPIEQLRMFAIFAEEFGSTLHEFFWPGLPDVKSEAERRQAIRRDMERWQPYDAAAWDHFFIQLHTVVQPFLLPARRHFETVNAYALGDSQKAENIRQMLRTVGQSVDALSIRTNQQEMEALLFRAKPAPPTALL